MASQNTFIARFGAIALLALFAKPALAKCDKSQSDYVARIASICKTDGRGVNLECINRIIDSEKAISRKSANECLNKMFD